MNKISRYFATLLLVGLWPFIAVRADDTPELVKSLSAVRGLLEISAGDYQRLQNQYLAWIDARIKAGGTPASMNRELQSAGVLPTWPDSVDDVLESHAGYLNELKERAVAGAKDVFVIEAGMYTGGACAIATTAIVYDRGSLQQLATISAAPRASFYAYYLSGIDVGRRDRAGRRLFASGWTASNCTSTWNGKKIRIDRFSGGSFENVMTRDLWAHDRDPENITPRIHGHTVSFEYDAGIEDVGLLQTPSIAVYRVTGGQVVREGPIALTRPGFIHEWLSMSDANPRQWAQPAAMEKRSAVAAEVNGHLFESTAVARCGGSPQVWEIAVHLRDSEKDYVFRIAGTRARELRMIDITSHLTPSCPKEDIRSDSRTLNAELPR